MREIFVAIMKINFEVKFFNFAGILTRIIELMVETIKVYPFLRVLETTFFYKFKIFLAKFPIKRGQKHS